MIGNNMNTRSSSHISILRPLLPFALMLAALSPAASQALEQGKPAPDFSVTALDGSTFKLSDLRGKVIVLNFWHVTCPPCIEEMPGLNTIVQENAGRDVVFIALCSDGRKAIRRFLKKHPFAYHIVENADSIDDLYGVEGHPTHVVIDRDGNVATLLLGGGSFAPSLVRAGITNALK
ncbi:MAG: TlpA family protein disulfide reductase [Bacteroidetes bacterium]|nr:TlpA family protein disulfide reductase [Bacteroidota bacterium]